MNWKKVTAWALLTYAILTPSVVPGAEAFRTDINPALLYWQAWAQIPDLPETDRGYLFTNDWRGRTLEARAGELLGRYDNVFKLLHRAGKAVAPCDWGYDLTEGPEVLLPGLAKAKSIAQTARLRFGWNLQQGKTAAARDELIAAFVQGRQLSKDRILISALVQFAIENICLSAVAENFPRLSPETLNEILQGFDSAPPRGTIGDCIATERTSFYDWMLRKLGTIQKESQSSKEGLEKARGLLDQIVSSPDEPRSGWSQEVIEAAGGSLDSLIQYVKALDPVYVELEQILRRPHAEAVAQIRDFNGNLAKHPNLLAKEFLGPFEKSLTKEFRAQIKLTLLRAAIAYRKHGQTGLASVPDPASGKPFDVEPFRFRGVDRGFQLWSALDLPEGRETVVFCLKEGPPIHLDGRQAGKPLQ